VVSIDRQEIGSSDKSAIQELQENLNIPVVSIANLQDLINHIETSKNLIEYLSSMKRYQSKYCSI
jgi:orotate phosphoribosyltransferase